MNRIVIPLPANEELAARLASANDDRLVQCTFRRFPDGETYVRMPEDPAGIDVVLVCTLDRPDDKFLPLYFLASHLRESGARKIVLVAPYLPYMRQDRRFNPGEAITSRAFAALVSKCVDSLVTVDPHLHRYSSLGEVYSIPTRLVHAAPAIAAWIRNHVDNPVLVGPDIESAQWLTPVAAEAGLPSTLLQKVRHGDRDVEVTVPAHDPIRTGTPVLLDDIISTARTMIEVTRRLAQFGTKPPVCIGIHAIFADDALAELERAGAIQVVTCNTIRHVTNGIDIVPWLNEALCESFP